MKLPSQCAPVHRDRRLHPLRGIQPNENGVYPASIIAQQFDEIDEIDEDDDFE